MTISRLLRPKQAEHNSQLKGIQYSVTFQWHFCSYALLTSLNTCMQSTCDGKLEVGHQLNLAIEVKLAILWALPAIRLACVYTSTHVAACKHVYIKDVGRFSMMLTTSSQDVDFSSLLVKRAALISRGRGFCCHIKLTSKHLWLIHQTVSSWTTYPVCRADMWCVNWCTQTKAHIVKVSLVQGE